MFNVNDIIRYKKHYRRGSRLSARFHVYAKRFDDNGTYLKIALYDGRHAGESFGEIALNDARFELVGKETEVV